MDKIINQLKVLNKNANIIQFWWLENRKITDKLFWNNLKKVNKSEYTNKIKYLLTEFGTKECCNRFDVGNSIEFLIADMVRETGYDVIELPNARRIDMCINSNYKFSIKYSSVGDITLHNSNSQVNKDTKFNDLLLLTPKKLHLITNENLKEYNIDVNKYIKNCGDSLKLKRKILKELENSNFVYEMDFDIQTDKSLCKNRLCSKVFYKSFLEEYNSKITYQDKIKVTLQNGKYCICLKNNTTPKDIAKSLFPGNKFTKVKVDGEFFGLNEKMIKNSVLEFL